MTGINDAQTSPAAAPVSGRIKSIDGLRALAILAVLIFHIDEAYLPGGYLGVDLFFVISGFVVTRSLLHKQQKYGQFLASRFYRLAPAAAATIFVTLIVFNSTGSGLLDPTHSISAIAASVALSNVYFMMQDSYFNGALQGNPFLHFWSLSVEEQFYLIWPFVVALLIKWPLTGRILFVGVLALFSLVAFSVMPAQAFFFMPARAFQFASGACVFLLFARFPVQMSPIFLYVCIALCAIPFLFLHGSEAWLINTLAPTVLFCGLLYTAAAAKDAFLLRLPPIQWIGAASYSIYLVHWPIIVYLYILNPRSVAVQTIAFAGAFVLGFALHYLIERPFNKPPLPQKRSRHRHFSIKPIAIGGPLLTLATITFAGLLSANAAKPETNTDSQAAMVAAANLRLQELLPQQKIRTPDPVATTVKSAQASPLPSATIATPASSQIPALSAPPLKPNPLVLADPSFVFSSTKAAREQALAKGAECNTHERGHNLGQTENAKILSDLNLASCLAGDSILISDSTWSVAALMLATELKTSNFAQLNAAGCLFVDGSVMEDCDKMNALRWKLLAGEERHYSTVYLAFNWLGYEDRLAPFLEKIAKSGANVVLLTPLPSFDSNPDQIVAANASAGEDLTPWLKDGIGEVRSKMEKAADDNANINLLRWSSLDGQDLKLPALNDKGEKIYSDYYHYSPKGRDWLLMNYLQRSYTQMAKTESTSL